MTLKFIKNLTLLKFFNIEISISMCCIILIKIYVLQEKEALNFVLETFSLKDTEKIFNENSRRGGKYFPRSLNLLIIY